VVDHVEPVVFHLAVTILVIRHKPVGGDEWFSRVEDAVEGFPNVLPDVWSNVRRTFGLGASFR